MCYSPVTIPNPRTDFRQVCDKLYQVVPCGHCEECRRQKRDDWFVRLYYEYFRYKKEYPTGCVKFPTLTFNDNSLPMLDLDSEDFDFLRVHYPDFPHGKIPSFDKYTVRNFFRKLRTLLVRIGYLPQDNTFKYFLVCEYGDEFGRPHYHVIMFFPRFISDSMLKILCERCWSDFVNPFELEDNIPAWFIDSANQYFRLHPDYHTFAPIGKGDVSLYLATKDSRTGYIRFAKKRGNVSFSNKYGGTVTSPDALSYITKYLYKDSAFDKLPSTKLVKYWVDTLMSDGGLDNFPIQLRLLKSIFPFRLSSQGLGMSLYEELMNGVECPRTSEEYIMRLINQKISLDGQDRFYRIPDYIIRKIFYEFQTVSRLVPSHFDELPELKVTKKTLLTPLGALCVKKRFALQVSSMADSYRRYLFGNYFDSVRSYVAFYPNLLERYDKCLSILHDSPKDIDVELLAIYKLKFQDLPQDNYEHYNIYDCACLKKLAYGMHDYHIASYNDIHLYSKITSDYIELGLRGSLPMFNTNPCFAGFDIILSALDNLRNIVSEVLASEQKKSKQAGETLRSYINSLIYN